MKGLRIAIVGWAESVHVQRWARGLAGRGFEIKVISLGGKPIEDVETTIIPRTGRLSYLTEASKATAAIRDFKPDLVHAHYATGNGWWGLKSDLQPLVISVWGADVMDFPSNFLKRAMVKRILNGADHITATSQLLKKVTLELLPSANGKTTVIPFGVELPGEIRQMPKSDRVRVCFVKALTAKYGPDILIKAFAKAVKVVPELELSIAGQGEMLPSLQALVDDLSMAERITFVGQLPYERVMQFISEHDFMVMPSTMASESFGVAVLEAGACGRTVIASEIGGVPEVSINNETGLLTPPGDINQLADAITRLASDRQLCERLGRNNYKFVKQKYKWESSLDMMSELYQKLVRSE